MTRAASASGARVLPVDSEHNAIFQCFDHDEPRRIAKIILTASGGPFRTKSKAEMARMTPAEAVRHPNWSMGAKISVDSATLMNKGLELIEAHHLFPIGADRFEILVHPQSVVHSMVEYIDGSVLAQLGTPDMRTPIAHTLAWPERMPTPCQRLDLAAIGRLEFEAPDPERFPALRLARAALEDGGSRPTVLNAANEAAVAAFLANKIGFLDIAFTVGKVLDRYDPPAPASLEDVVAIDTDARAFAEQAMEVLAA
jgi:1-deoxy-D-xylulose-5-phosphate reductoisomerase